MPDETPAPALPLADVHLREWRDDDLHMVRVMALEPEIWAAITLPLNADDATALGWIRQQQRRRHFGLGESFAIADANDSCVGYIGLWTASQGKTKASIGYAVPKAWRGRGYAKAALVDMVRCAWETPTMQRIELYIEPRNEASRRTAESVGFVFEELLPEHEVIGRQRVDMCRYVLTRPTA